MPSLATIFSAAAVAPGVDQKTRTTSVRIQPNDAGDKLRPGMLAQVSIITGMQSNALLVPREAVLGTPLANTQAMVVTLDGNRAQRTTVRLGLVNDQVITMPTPEHISSLDFESLLSSIELTKEILDETAPIISQMDMAERSSHPARPPLAQRQ